MKKQWKVIPGYPAPSSFLCLLVLVALLAQFQTTAQAQQRDRGPSPYVEENNQIRRDKFDVILPAVMR